MKRAMAKQAETEREKRAKIINAEGESLAASANAVTGCCWGRRPPATGYRSPLEERRGFVPHVVTRPITETDIDREAQRLTDRHDKDAA